MVVKDDTHGARRRTNANDDSLNDDSLNWNGCIIVPTAPFSNDKAISCMRCIIPVVCDARARQQDQVLQSIMTKGTHAHLDAEYLFFRCSHSNVQYSGGFLCFPRKIL